MAEGDKSIFEFKAVLEVIGLSASVIGALGYASLRSYLNFLGVAATVEFSFDQLLYEAYAVGLSILLGIIVVLLLGSGLGLLLWGGMKLVPQSIVHRIAGLTACSKRYVRPIPLTLVSFLVGTVIAILLFRNVVNRTGVLFLYAKDLAGVVQRPILFLISIALLLVTIGAYSLIRWHDAEALNPALRFTTRFSVAILTLSLLWIATIAYNVHVRGMKFPLVMITDRQGKPESSACGLLVYSTSKMLILWYLRSTADGAIGIISVRARNDDDRLLVLGDRDVRDCKECGFLSNLATCGLPSAEQHVRALPTTSVAGRS